MLQLFNVDVVKVDRDVAYVTMVVHVYCKGLFLMFHLFFDVCCKCVLSEYCIYFTHVASVLSGYCVCFAMVFKCFQMFFL
jgi:hypothetical protein